MANNPFLVPIVGTICTAVVLGLFFMFRHRTRAQMQQTLRAALDRGHDLTPDIIRQLVQPERPDADWRRALVWIAVGIGCALFGLILDEDDAVRPFIAIGAFPFVIGIAYLIMSRFSENERSN